ncbi:hypothetical protein QTP88_027032 [Uroleucon formosanum]
MAKWFNRLAKYCLPVARRDQSHHNYYGVIKMGYNLTSSNKKIFLVLREVSTIGLCLEYYPNKSKWIKNALPKKQIELKSCINIEKRVDKCTNKTSIYLCTKVKSFYIQFDEDKELDEWLHLLNSLVNKPENSLKDVFKNVWYISILEDNLGINTKLTGMTGFSLCDKKVKFTQYPIKSNEQKSVDIMLSSILCCGVSNSLFYIELESTSPFGSGQIWMETNRSNVSNAIFDILQISISNLIRHLDIKNRKNSSEVIPRKIDSVRFEDDFEPYDVKQMLYSIISNICITAIRCCGFYEKQFLRALSRITNGINYTSIDSVYTQLKNDCWQQGTLNSEIPNGKQVVKIACRLKDYNLIIVKKEKNDVFNKVSLKVKPELLHYALDTQYNSDFNLLQ